MMRRLPCPFARRWAWLFVFLLAACGGEAKRTPLPAGSVIVVLGDSISAGHGLLAEQAWPVLLAEATGWQIVNAGISGDMTAQGLDRLPVLLDNHRPRAVILELGGNDMLRRVPDAAIVSNLSAMIALVRGAGGEPILMATPRPSVAGAVFSSLSDAPFYDRLAKAEGTGLIDQVLSDVLSDPALKHDQLHPNAEGQMSVARGVAGKLQKMGYLR